MPEDPARPQRFGRRLQEEMTTRGWTTRDVAERHAALTGEDYERKELELDLILYFAEEADPNVIIGDETVGCFTLLLREA